MAGEQHPQRLVRRQQQGHERRVLQVRGRRRGLGHPLRRLGLRRLGRLRQESQGPGRRRCAAPEEVEDAQDQAQACGECRFGNFDSDSSGIVVQGRGVAFFLSGKLGSSGKGFLNVWIIDFPPFASPYLELEASAPTIYTS